MRAALFVLVLACGGKPKDNGELVVPQVAAGSGSATTATEPTEPAAAAEKHEAAEPTTPYTNTDLAAGDEKPKGGQAEIAWTKNQEGVAAMNAAKYSAASAAFRDAVARMPEPRYFLNLCMALYQEGKFGEALTACNAVLNTTPTPAIQVKADRMIGRIKFEAQKQGIDVR